MNSLLSLVALLQPAATGAGEAVQTTGGGAPTQAPPFGCDPGMMSMMPLLLMFAAFYFLAIRPQTKRQRELEAMIKALSKGDIVRTTGGIRGEVTQLSETEVTLLISDRTKINVLRSHVAALEHDDKNT